MSASFPHFWRIVMLTSIGGLLLVFNSQSASARESDAETENYFLKGHDFGSESLFSPLSVILNSGFDIFRSGSYDKRLTKLKLGVGATNVFRNITRPARSIRRSGGVGEFVAHEVFPYREFNPEHGHFVPNYFLHVLGEGMLFRKLSEYYRQEQFEYPRIVALLTLGTAQYLNESVENGGYRGANVDPIADILFFNPIGWLLFSHDSVARFFSSDEFMSIHFWPGQPALDFQDLSLYNTGESYVFRIRFGADTRFSSFNYMGSEGLTGLSYRLPSGDQFSLAGGYRVVWLEADQDDDSRVMVPSQPGNLVGAFFWDRHESLLMSLKAGMNADPTVRVNLYPGSLHFASSQLGAFLWASPHDGFVSGITVSMSPVGLAFRAGGTRERAQY